MAQSSSDQADMAQGRMISVVIAATMIGWMGLQWLGGQMDWPPKYIFLADLSAAASFIWSMVAAWRIWVRRQA